MAHSVSLSRGTSRTSKTGSNKSRSLIKKHIEMHDLNAADLLIERFTAWKIIVKQLASWFEGYADIENNAAREMIKLSAIIQVPFRSGNHFLGEGGLQVCTPCITPFLSFMSDCFCRMCSMASETSPDRFPTSMPISVVPSTALSSNISRSSSLRSKLTWMYVPSD